ncbi:HAMP domain-containing sensor histidine kinase [Nocardioides sp. CFH 31398]|uniref:sensor histidine kinase n=1 Tax=Nocardioides sp. CFH 31398 TaxID=2919579 RepID=UPI001F05907C|nr:HAMP domain-containing sensor histidine kinase [Nocardioides sp. CFH 31398]MCH1867528.1 HAMP domain-containing histidine kinase [Nocardioides sp. CFH 31398]
MSARTMPRDVWGPGGTAVVVAVLLTPLLLAAQLDLPVERVLAHGGLTVAVIGLGVSLVLYVHWRLVTHPAAAWLVAAVTLVATQAALLETLYVAEPGRMARGEGWMLTVHLAVGLLLLAGASLVRRAILLTDPLLLGLCGGLTAAAVRWVLVDLAPPLAVPHVATVALGLAVLGVGLAVAWAVSRVPGLPSWVLARIAAAVGLLVVGEIALYLRPGSPTTGVMVVCQVVAGVLLLSTSIGLLRHSIREGQLVLARLRCRLAETEEQNRVERARLHEIKATVAGIASASQLLQDAGRLSPGRAARLAEMLQSETARVERLLAADDVSALQPVDLDEAIRPLVTRLGARGVDVDWRPSEVVACGRPDQVTEVVGILLENSACHAGGEGVSVDVRPCADRVEIVVSDDGPGVDPDVRDSLFDWGVRGRGSSGQGIGLHVAQQLVAEQGGHLRWSPGHGAGTAFVVELPVVRTSRRAVAG